MGAFLSVLAVMGALLSLSGSPVITHPPTIQFSSKPAILAVKRASGDSEDDDKKADRLSYRALLQARCPSLFTEFKPLWWLFNGHMQTLYCVFGDFSKRDRMSYLRKTIRVADGGTLGLDFAPVDQASLKEDTPIVIVQHGLTGGSYEPYVRAVLSHACASVAEGGLGYRAVVINFRGCAGIPITSPRLYSAGHTDDTRNALAYISQQYPNARLLGLGFSLGANVLTRYLGEEGEATRLHSVCALGCPWNLKHNNQGLLNTFVGKHIYSKGMGGNLQNLLRKHRQEITADPTHHVAVAANIALALKNPTLGEFDESFTRIAGGPPPHFPFANSDDYYVWGSSDKVIPQIAVPFLGINADDDPVVTRVPLESVENGLVAIRMTRGGGHLGWFTAGDGFVDRWTTQPVLEWLKLMGEDFIIERESKAAKMFVDEDGWLREEGRPHLGSKYLNQTLVVDGNHGESGVLQGL
ncbi:hypothetical protein D9611_004676 [Ephemerocybe angulata]|uniref:Alpha/Beta hydrolase protein n=2 Tax=Ephemerocybe angulata TaxID=980116 RepID=A0A8H6MGQ8_9AGAR|nr:hypothetical protein D9611_004676 [Tulosesus angulatus]KAF6765186.1 Alpha/Beta hydrolase protein [Tulosesus angulatus]